MYGFWSAVVLVFAWPVVSFASIAPTATMDQSGNIIYNPSVANTGYLVQIVVTFYGPGTGGSMEGGWSTSRPDQAGQSVPHTLDDVRLGRSKYVTLASDPSNYGKWYKIPYVKYRSPIDAQFYTLTNVVGYVHDTGSAFKGRPDKMDVAVGNFTGQSDSQAAQVISGDTASNQWTQIGGQVDVATQVSGPQGGGYTPSASITTAPVGYAQPAVSAPSSGNVPLVVGGVSYPSISPPPLTSVPLGGSFFGTTTIPSLAPASATSSPYTMMSLVGQLSSATSAASAAPAVALNPSDNQQATLSYNVTAIPIVSTNASGPAPAPNETFQVPATVTLPSSEPTGLSALLESMKTVLLSALAFLRTLSA